MQKPSDLPIDASENVRVAENDPQQMNPELSKPNRKLSKIRKIEFIFSVLNQLLIGFVTIYMCWMCLRINDWGEIPWHAVFCTLGFLCLMSEGLLAHYRGNAWTQSCNRDEKTRTHWILQSIGTLLGISGILIKIILEEQHFHTLHGKIGLATFVLHFWSLLTGFGTFYAHEMRKNIQPLLNKATHTILGLMTFILITLSIYSAFETDIFLEYSLDGKENTNFCLFLQITVILIFILSSYGPIWSLIYSKLWKCC